MVSAGAVAAFLLPEAHASWVNQCVKDGGQGRKEGSVALVTSLNFWAEFTSKYFTE